MAKIDCATSLRSGAPSYIPTLRRWGTTTISDRIDPEDGEITYKDGGFRLRTTRNYVIIRNGRGTARFYPLPRSVRPFRD